MRRPRRVQELGANISWRRILTHLLKNKPRSSHTLLWAVLLAGYLVVSPASPQTASVPSQREETSLTGVVASSTRNTLVVRGENGQFHLFVLERETVKSALAIGSTVRVVSIPGDEAGVRVATEITPVAAAASARPGGGQASQPVPREVRQLERDIERQ